MGKTEQAIVFEKEEERGCFVLSLLGFMEDFGVGMIGGVGVGIVGGGGDNKNDDDDKEKKEILWDPL